MIKTLWHKQNEPFHFRKLLKPTIFLDVASILYGTVLLVSIFFGCSWMEATIIGIEGLASLAIGYFNFKISTHDYLISQTVDYTITENGISFQWGLLSTQQDTIAFDEVSKLTLEKYEEDERCNIIIESRNDDTYHGYDHKIMMRRKTPSIDNIEDGQQVFELIKKELNDKGVEFETEAHLLHYKSALLEFKGQNLNVSRNLMISRTYLFLVVIIGLYFTDTNILTPDYFHDRIVKASDPGLPENSGLLSKYKTEQGYVFSTTKWIGTVDDPIYLSVSPIYHTVNGAWVKNENKSSSIISGFNGLSKLLYTTLCIALLLGAFFIQSKNGIILSQDVNMAFVIPLTFLGLSIMNWLIMNLYI